MKILTVVGARPQFIKAAVISRAILQHNQSGHSTPIEEEILHTGQHYDPAMSQAFFDQMEIPEPVINLNIGSGLHGQVTGAMLAGIEQEILKRRPDWVVVFGDTNSTLAGALAAAKLHVPIAHVESGMRSFSRKMPEEINRILTDHIADLLFCSSEAARDQLAREGITQGVHLVGDVMFDAVLFYRDRAIVPDRGEQYALASLHRAENTDDPIRLEKILGAMGQSPVPVRLPLHPRTRKMIDQGSIALSDNVTAMEPLPYLSMLGHLQEAAFVITDSGGLQKEAYFYGKRCITVREQTEWTELVTAGVNRVVGADAAAIRAAFDWALQPLNDLPELYGRGDAGLRIVRRLAEKTG